ncbi:MAG: cupin domain-containing protein [Bauldia sp.]|nr:cupin domain-containing protein [Bauldia sp.]
MPIVSADAAPTFDIPGVTFTGLAAPSRGASENAVWRFVMQPGTPANLHRLSREEVLVAISGSARVSIGGAESEFTAGSAVIVPPDTEFALYNPGVEPFEAVAVLPVGGQAVIGDAKPFTPPWAE